MDHVYHSSQFSIDKSCKRIYANISDLEPMPGTVLNIRSEATGRVATFTQVLRTEEYGTTTAWIYKAREDMLAAIPELREWDVVLFA